MRAAVTFAAAPHGHLSAVGRSADDGHNGFYLATAQWEPDVLRFLDLGPPLSGVHASRMSPARARAREGSAAQEVRPRPAIRLRPERIMVVL